MYFVMSYVVFISDLGLQLARQIAVVSYRSADVYESRFSRQRAIQQKAAGEGEEGRTVEDDDEERQFEVCRYLDYQVSK